MITVCELCNKVNKKNEEVKIAELFCETILSPIIENLQEIPKHYYLGMIYRNFLSDLYKGTKPWKKEYTNRGYVVRRRSFEKIVGHFTPVYETIKADWRQPLNLVLVNKYLEPFGFMVEDEEELILMDEYESGVGRNLYCRMSKLYLTALCPEENK